MLSLLGGVFLGWSLGANDAANIFGTAVSSKMIRFWTAAVLASIFVILGAMIDGQAGIHTLKGLTGMTLADAITTSVAAALTVTIMTVLSQPVSTSQAVVGAIVGAGILNNQLNLAGLGKVVLCWIGTPIGAALFTLILYPLVGAAINRLRLSLFHRDMVIRTAMIIVGCYGAYSLGANNVANVTAVFVGAGLITVFQAAAIGGLSIAAGILTFSRPVMNTVGKRLVHLDPFSALMVVSALSVTIHLFTLIGVPVSSSQAVIGAVLGIGLIKGSRTVNAVMLKRILTAWCLTPAVACFFSVVIDFATHLQYIPKP